MPIIQETLQGLLEIVHLSEDVFEFFDQCDPLFFVILTRLRTMIMVKTHIQEVQSAVHTL